MIEINVGDIFYDRQLEKHIVILCIEGGDAYIVHETDDGYGKCSVAYLKYLIEIMKSVDICNDRYEDRDGTDRL